MGCCGPDIPGYPDPGVSAREGIYAELENYPEMYKIDQAARMGQKITIDGKTYDFTGTGDAAYQEKYSNQMAQAMLDIQKKYGKDFIGQRLKELELSDPTSFKFRQELFDKIIGDAGKGADLKTAEDLQASVMGELSKGGTLDPYTRRQVEQDVMGGQAARGMTMGSAPASQVTAGVASASESIRADRQNQALKFLTSGQAPEDQAYRRTQQNISNLANFSKGITPQAQFGQLRGAQQGAAPFAQTGTGMSLKENAGIAGMQEAGQYWQANANAQLAEGSQWMGALGVGLNSLGAMYNLGGGSSGFQYPYSIQGSGSSIPSMTANATF